MKKNFSLNKIIENMTVVILAGGFGSRIGEYTKNIPKPMIMISGKPIISHLIDYYKSYGLKNFIIAGGYKYKILENYFKNKKNIKVINTGIKTLTGTRVKKLSKYLSDTFFLTYGDGLSNVNIKNSLLSHLKFKKMITMTAVRPIARFGEINVRNNKLISFEEKPQLSRGWINGGFFVINKDFIKLIPNKNVMLEREPILNAIRLRQINLFMHNKFWFCVDTLRDLFKLRQIAQSKKCPWKK
jgi:glucose-1-phosphate cytidylyltransferase